MDLCLQLCVTGVLVICMSATSVSSMVYLEASYESKNLTTPGYPNSYQSSADNQWNIRPAYHYYAKINIEIIFLDIEYSLNCINDGLRIYKENRGGKSPVLTICGNTSSVSSLNVKGSVHIEFSSNNETEGQGFILQYSLVYDDEHDEEYNEHGYTQNWGVAMLVVFVIVIIVMVIAIIVACYCQRRLHQSRDGGPYKHDIATVLGPTSGDTNDQIAKNTVI